LPHADRRSTKDIGTPIANRVIPATDRHFIYTIIDPSVISAGAEAADSKSCDLSPAALCASVGDECRFELDTKKKSPENLQLMKMMFPLILALLCLFVAGPRTEAVSPPPDGDYPGLNTAEGLDALLSLTSGEANTAVGWLSLQTVTTGELNTGVGAGTLVFNTGSENTAIGAAALFGNTTGRGNTATGSFALIKNTEGQFNTANGVNALGSNRTGSENTATGNGALFNNTESGNTANGASALFANTTGHANTAMGKHALFTNVSGLANTAMGSYALATNISGTANTAIGNNALAENTGDSNTAVGNRAIGTNTRGTHNTAVGAYALLNNTGNFNTALGAFAGVDLTTGDDNIDIGFGVKGVPGESNTIRIGDKLITATFIRGISGATAAGGAAVFVTPNGHLGTATSSARFKDEIKPMGDASEAILALRPVSFRYKKEIDPQGIPEFGLVAEEVEKVNPGLIIRDPEGRPYTVRYEQVNAMLLNEFLKEHHTVQDQGATIVLLQKQVEGLTAGLQKVSAQLEVSKAAPQAVLNGH